MKTWNLLRALFSERGRTLKALVPLALVALISWRFLVGPGRGGSAYLGISRGEIPASEVDRPVGPEHLRVLKMGDSGLLLEKFGVEVEMEFGPGPEGERARASAAALGPGSHVSVISRHLEGNRFQILELIDDRQRPWKLIVSGIAALAVLAALPVFFRLERGGLADRSAPQAASRAAPPAGDRPRPAGER